MARPRKRVSVRIRESAQRREQCELARLEKMDRAWILAEYERQVEAGGVCLICGRPLVDPDSWISINVWSELGPIHEACA
jgi:hypothetical protein